MKSEDYVNTKYVSWQNISVIQLESLIELHFKLFGKSSKDALEREATGAAMKTQHRFQLKERPGPILP